MRGIYRLAEKTIEICSVYASVHELCADYCSDGTPEISAQTTQVDIDHEREKSEREDRAIGVPVRQFPEDYLETLAVYRKIAEQMPAYDTFLFHGSAVAVGGEGYLFTAKSGTGKSTHTRLWRELPGIHAVMVNDDKPLIRVTEDGAVIYGTPWDGKHHLSNNIEVPLKGICILERAAENRICSLTKKEALPMLIGQAYRPADPKALALTLSLIERMEVALYRLSCNMDISAAELAWRTMQA